ncbi:conserved hypothetical protein [gamma proteobacterium HdN1]|nr:conserved hypothetical protein [gamma proteobacterium HdN1]
MKHNVQGSEGRSAESRNCGAWDANSVRRCLLPFRAQQSGASKGAGLFQPALGAYRCFYSLEFEKEFSSLEITIGTHEVAGYQIVMHAYRQTTSSMGCVFLLHGYYDHVGIYSHIIRALLASGYSVVTFDLPGHGLSSGEPAAIDDFQIYQVVLREVFLISEGFAPKPWHAVGQSTGGAILLDFLLAQSRCALALPFERCVLLAPLVRPFSFTTGKYAHTALSPFVRRIKRKFVVNSHDDVFLRFLRDEDPLQSHYLSVKWVGALKEWVADIENRKACDYPLTVIQGQEDTTVDFPHNLQVLREKFPLMEIVLFPTGRHQLVNESARLRGEIFAQMLRGLKLASA